MVEASGSRYYRDPGTTPRRDRYTGLAGQSLVIPGWILRGHNPPQNDF